MLKGQNGFPESHGVIPHVNHAVGPSIDENGAVVVLLDGVQVVKKAKSVTGDELVDEACGSRVVPVCVRSRAISRVEARRPEQPMRITPLIGFTPVV